MLPAQLQTPTLNASTIHMQAYVATDITTAMAGVKCAPVSTPPARLCLEAGIIVLTLCVQLRNACCMLHAHANVHA